MLEHIGLDVDKFITIQAMASTFMLNSGCYDNVYQISGALQQFSSRCVVGGRVMTNSNKQYHVTRTIAYCDACYLYPSAMYYMYGCFEDKPKLLNDKVYEFLNNNTICLFYYN